MMRLPKISLFLLALALLAAFAYPKFTFSKKGNPTSFKDGDILFIESMSGQGKAIALATGSKYTHIGIVFLEKGEPRVYHAVEPVTNSSLDDFLDYSSNHDYVLKRLPENRGLNKKQISTMHEGAKKWLGTHYDIYFNWGDTELYCSELVYKLYQKAGITLCDLHPLKDYQLNHPEVKRIMERRYGKNIPWEEKMVSPGDVFASDSLIQVDIQK